MALPYGYKQVEYIESTGAQYIDTGIIPVSDIRIEADFMLTESQSTGGIVSAELTWQSNMCSIDAWAYRYGTGYQQHTLTANKRYAVVLDNGVFTENGTQVFTASGSVSTSIPLTIFAVNRGDSQNEFAKARLYSAKITTNGNTVREFVPCINSSGEVGLYDAVSGSFFGNSGTGTLLSGEVITTAIPGITCVVGNTHHQISCGYVNISGVWKPLDEIFTNINGVWCSNISKQIIYTWKKYNTVTTTKDGWAWGTTKKRVQMSTYGASVTGYENRQPTFTVTYSNGKIAKMTTTTYGEVTRTVYQIIDSDYLDYYKFINPSTDWSNGALVPDANLYYKFAGSYGGDVLSGTGYVSVYEPVYTPTISYAQGSYIGEVIAETENAYPNNGRHTDGYWYVKQS